MIDLELALNVLARKRPIFHSEADFQHELAFALREQNSDIEIRLERPLDRAIGAIDAEIRIRDEQYNLELKYLTKQFSCSHKNENFALKQQGAHPLRRYDVCKDIARIESLKKQTGMGGAVVALTNDPAYWRRKTLKPVIDEAYRLGEGRELNGQLTWDSKASFGTKKGREKPICLEGNYRLAWKSYGDLKTLGTEFRFLQINV